MDKWDQATLEEVVKMKQKGKMPETEIVPFDFSLFILAFNALSCRFASTFWTRSRRTCTASSGTALTAIAATTATPSRLAIY